MENPHEVYYCPSCGKFEEKKEVYANEKNRICSRCNLELLPTGKTKEEWGKEILGEEFDYYSVPYQEKDKVNEYLREKFVYHNSQFNPKKSQERAEYSRNFRKSILNNMKSKELKANATVSENIIKFYGGTNEMAISKDMIIADLIALDPNYAAILMASGMGCVGCPSSQGESIEQAAYVHGMDLDELLGRLNEYAQTKEA